MFERHDVVAPYCGEIFHAHCLLDKWASFDIIGGNFGLMTTKEIFRSEWDYLGRAK